MKPLVKQRFASSWRRISRVARTEPPPFLRTRIVWGKGVPDEETLRCRLPVIYRLRTPPCQPSGLVVGVGIELNLPEPGLGGRATLSWPDRNATPSGRVNRPGLHRDSGRFTPVGSRRGEQDVRGGPETPQRKRRTGGREPLTPFTARMPLLAPLQWQGQAVRPLAITAYE